MKLKISAIVALIGLSLSALGLGRLLNREEINSFVPDGKQSYCHLMYKVSATRSKENWHLSTAERKESNLSGWLR